VRRSIEALALILSVGALVFMLLPTYTLVFGASGGEYVFRTFPWFDPLLLGYAAVIPAISLVCGVAMVIGLAVGLVRGRTRGWIGVVGLIASVVLLTFGYDTNSSGFVSGAGQFVAPILAVASALAGVAWWLGRRSAA
jgi:hypothetical protein